MSYFPAVILHSEGGCVMSYFPAVILHSQGGCVMSYFPAVILHSQDGCVMSYFPIFCSMYTEVGDLAFYQPVLIYTS